MKTIIKNTNPLYCAVAKHPVTCLGVLCLLLAGVFTQGVEITFAPTAPLVLALTTLIAAAGVYPNPKRMMIVFLSGVLIGISGYLLTLSSYFLPLTIAVFGSMVLVGIALVLLFTGQLTQKRGLLLLLMAGFLLRLCYVLYTTAAVRQHDVWYFSDGDFLFFQNQRHAEYIEYIAANLKFPYVDPTSVGLSQLYHPPLHHFIAGLWLRLNTTLGIEYSVAVENIQLLTLFYSSSVMVIAYRILRFLKCKGLSLFLPLSLVVFHPTFIFMAGSVNNDLLSITLAIYALYATLRWAKNPTIKTIVPIALGIGGAMMAKLSGGMIAPAVALVFLWKWWEAIKQKDGSGKKLFWQFVIFGLICVPLGLWWQVKNMVAFGVPLTYVPALSENSGQFVGDYTPLERLLEFPHNSFQNVFVVWQNQGMKADYNEYNMLLALVKSSVFGEFTLFDSASQLGIHKAGIILSHILFYANTLLIGCSLFSGIYLFTKKEHRHSPAFWLFGVVWVVLLISYLRFCFGYPQTCTQNFRYAVPTLISGCVWLGCALKYTKNRTLQGGAIACTLVFCLSSAVCYTLLGLV